MDDKAHISLNEIEVLYSDTNSKKESERDEAKQSTKFVSEKERISSIHPEAHLHELGVEKKIGFYTKTERMLKIRKYKAKVKRWLMKKKSSFSKRVDY
jgi:hypothetical protein